MSKIETRKQLPSEDDIAAWDGAVGATPETASDLLAMLRGARVEYAAWKDAYRQSGAGGVQADMLELEAQTTRIAEFQPGMISGLLQTSEYAREFLHLAWGTAQLRPRRGRDRPDGREADAAAAGALSAREAVHVAMLEGALRARVVSVPTLIGQLDRLLAVIGLPTLSFLRGCDPCRGIAVQVERPQRSEDEQSERTAVTRTARTRPASSRNITESPGSSARSPA